MVSQTYQRCQSVWIALAQPPGLHTFIIRALFLQEVSQTVCCCHGTGK